MRDFVYADDMVIAAYKVDDYYPFACVERCTIKMSSGMVETTEPSSGAWDHFAPDGRNRWSASASGVQVLQDVVDTLWFSWETLRLQLRTQGLNLKFTWKDKAGNDKYATGFAWIPESALESESGDLARWDLQLLGSGPLDINGVLVPPVNPKVMRIDWTTTGNEPNKLQDNRLIGLLKEDILQVSFEGNDVFEIIDAGDPSAKQVRLDNVEGSLRWLYDFEAGQKVHALILNN